MNLAQCQIFLLFFLDDVASRSKEVPAIAGRPKHAAPAELDYTDIPHSQIRKVVYIILFILSPLISCNLGTLFELKNKKLQ